MIVNQSKLLRNMNSRSHPDGPYGHENEYVRAWQYACGISKPHYPMPITFNLAVTMNLADLGEFEAAAAWNN